ncbi:MAG: hypothetical protein M1829_004065 [Trizodia sp. TS-e1964]|nr:MAG: hypothetical protein M1829_004065 [Trizodia sp. TS-e1964]
MPSSPLVLKVPVANDDQESFVLLHVSPSGSLPWDLKIVATEGTSAFVKTVDQTLLARLKSKHFQGSQGEWESILSHLLLHKLLQGTERDSIKQTELVATTVADAEITISIRKRIGSMIQTLGSLSLPYDDNETIQLFEWTATAAESDSQTQTQVGLLTDRNTAQQVTILSLSRQLEDLVKAKEAHENALLENFRDLLNSKKLKIRDQQRLLAAVKVDSGTASKVISARANPASRNPGSSRSGKRKTSGQASPQEKALVEDQGTETESEDEREELDRAVTAETPDRTEDESTDGTEDFAPPKPPAGKAAVVAPAAVPKKDIRPSKRITSPPPRRELPFKKTAAPTRVLRNPPPGASYKEESDGESDDDEL